MKKFIFFLLFITCAMFLNSAGVSADQYTVVYPNGDSQTVFKGESWDEVNSWVLSYNNTEMTIGAVMLDPTGAPSNANVYGYPYFWIDVFQSYQHLYGSNDGVDWQFILTIETPE